MPKCSRELLGHVGFGGRAGRASRTRIPAATSLALGTLGVLGKGSIYGTHWIEPCIAGAASAQNVNLGADYKDVLTSVLPNTTGDTSSGAVTAPVKYINWSAAYSGAWWGERQSYTASAGVAFGVRGVINSASEFANERYNATPNYFYLRLGLSGNQTLPFGLRMSEKASAQWADSPLVNNEQYSLGGAETVRGYLEAEALGDSGFAGTVELHSPSLGSRVGSFLSPLYAFIFVDGGVATIVNPLPAQRENVTLWSDGVGIRLENSHGWTGMLDYATPRRDGVRTLKDSSRFDFLLRYGF